MPLQKIEDNVGNPWALWKIEETESELSSASSWHEVIPESIRHPHKRLEWYAARALMTALMAHAGLSFRGITKDEYGKPSPAGSSWNLSLSHSYPFVAAYLHATDAVGIDIQDPRVSLLRVAPRILDPVELEDAGGHILKLCVIWCAKEVLVKVHGKKDLIFAKNLKIHPFTLNSTGTISGSIIVNCIETTVPMYYEIHPEFTLVLNKP